MKVTFRIREEITHKNCQKISRFYCETKFWLSGWCDMFFHEDLDDECSPPTQVYFNTKQEARMAILEYYGRIYRTPTTEVRYH